MDLEDFLISAARGPVERVLSVFVLLAEIGAGEDEELERRRRVAPPSRQMQRRFPVFRRGIDAAATPRQREPHPFQAPLHRRGVQQRFPLEALGGNLGTGFDEILEMRPRIAPCGGRGGDAETSCFFSIALDWGDC